MRRAFALLVAHTVVAVLLLWPSMLDPEGSLPGSIRTDLWDSLWSFWFASRELAAGRLPISVDGLLNHPVGGTLWVADLVNALFVVPLLAVLTIPQAYTLLVHAHLVFSGVAANRLGSAVWGEDPRAGWFSGLAWQSAPLLLAHVHNGASEAIGGGWLALALLAAVRMGQQPSRGRIVGLGLALAVCSWAHWYAGVCAFLFCAVYGTGAVLAKGEALRSEALRSRALGWGAALCLGLLLTLPYAWASRSASTASDNVVGIKTERELAAVRRTIGAADPQSFFIPGDHRSPDLGKLSPYNEEHRHCPYLGWVVIVGAALSWRRVRHPSWWIAAVTGALLALGPVLTHEGAPVIIARKLAFPLPYLLLEPLPGFDSLSLVWRLAALPALCLTVLAGGGYAGIHLAGRLPVWGLAALLAVAETRFASPMRGAIATVSAEVAAPILALAEAPDGAVMNYPVVGGRPYLYEQTAHGRALAGTLNFPNNAASMSLWRLVLNNSGAPKPDFPRAFGEEAQKLGIRYIVLHVDAWAPADMHDIAARSVREIFTPMAETSAVRVYRLY